MSNSTAKVLKTAKALIEKGWTQYDYARGPMGNNIDYTSPDATCFCAVGAVLRATIEVSGMDHFQTHPTYALRYLAACIPEDTSAVHVFNDDPDTTKEDVLNVFDKAIEKAESY